MTSNHDHGPGGHTHDAEPVTEPQPVAVQFEDVIRRVSTHYANENARLVEQVALSREENVGLRRMVAERDARIIELETALTELKPVTS